MKHLKLPHFIIIITLFTLASLFLLSRTMGVPLEDVIFGIFVYLFYGLLFIGYILRFGLVFLGVFALYRMLAKQHNLIGFQS